MKILTIDRSALRMINADINSAIQLVARKYGVSIKTTNSTFSNKTATTKVEISVISANGVVNTPERDAFNRYAKMFGVTKNLGETFNHNGATFTISGFAPRSSKYPVLATDSRGKGYKFSVRAIQ